MKVLVLGGDGYCGWPTALHLSDVGHEVVIVDNCVRRTIDHELSAASLTPISDIKERIGAWREVSSQTIESATRCAAWS
jgi:UDP-sulfoquinovose synthase